MANPVITTGVLTGGSNSHATSSEEANALATDFVSAGVVGTFTNTGGVAPATGSFAVNASGSPDTNINLSVGVAYVQATPTSQNSQSLRVKCTVTGTLAISSNSSGSTKYDWIYISVSATNAANPAVAADNVATIVASRSSSASSDDGTPPTYGYPIAVVTVANGFSTITNANIRDIRTNAIVNLGSSSVSSGWLGLGFTPNTVTYNGNRSYSLVFNGTDLTETVSNGMRVKTTRLVTAPTQCTSLNGTTQFYSKTSPAGMTFTNNFVVSAWIKLAAYNSGANQVISSRYNGTSGWTFRITAAGQVALIGLNGGSGNSLTSQSYQSVPLNKWVHVAAQLDMTTTSTGGTNNYILIDGVEVPNTAVRAGTSPTALIQAGNLEIGSNNGGTETFNGKIAQVAIYSAKVTEANIRATISQTLAGTETSLISAYSFSNSINDLSANANNLTANGSAVATTVDNPFADSSGSLSYGIITSNAFSTNTTLTIQVSEGMDVPTTGGVSAVSYSTQKVPYGFPADKGKWDVLSLFRTQTNTTSNATYGSFSSNGFALTVPVGAWAIGYDLPTFTGVTTGMSWNISPISIIGSTSGAEDINFTKTTVSAVASLTFIPLYLRIPKNVLSSATYVLYTLGATTSPGIDGDNQLAQIIAEFNLL